MKVYTKSWILPEGELVIDNKSAFFPLVVFNDFREKIYFKIEFF